MSKEYDPTRDDGDESPGKDAASSQGQPRPRQPRSSRPDYSRDDIQRSRRHLPPARRFTPTRNTGGYTNQRPQQPQRKSTSPGQPPATPQRQPRDSRLEDEEYEQYQRYKRYQQSQRPRQNRQDQSPRQRDVRANDEENEQYQRYQRYRQSPQRDTHQYQEDQPGRSTRRPSYSSNDNSDYYDRPARRTHSFQSASPPTPSARQTRPRRRVGSTLLIGCLGGIVTIAIIVGIIVFVLFRVLPNSIPGFNIGASAYTSPQQTLPLPITAKISQLQIQNPVGNISITVDPNATTGTLTYIKKTVATSQGNATAEFARMVVTANPGSASACPAASCLAVTASIANSSNDAIDMMITLPPQNPSPTFKLSSTSQKGNISVQSFNGLLALTNDTGNISVKGGLLAAGSCLQDRAGNVTFAGTLETTIPPTINPCTGAPVSSSSASSDQPWYSMKTGTGNVDVTINTVSTTIQLDASINNQGKISSDFPLTIKQNSDGSSNYFGPLLPNTQPSALLTLTVDVSGNITLHKA